MLDTLAVAQEMTAGGIARDQAEAIANAMRKVAEQVDHVTADQFKAGQAEMRAEIGEVRTEIASAGERGPPPGPALTGRNRMARPVSNAESAAHTESMIPDARFWTDYFRQAIRQLQGFRVGVLEKVVPAFEGIAEDAERAIEAEHERLGPMSAYDAQIDMSYVADMAMEHRITVYETMFGVRQGVLNLLAVGLYHLFEQQQLFFLRRGLLSRGEDGPLKVAELEKRLGECGVEYQSLSCAGKLHELRTAANAIKHAKGRAGDKLAKLRPDLFNEPGSGNDAESSPAAVWAQQRAQHLLYTPLAGDGLYVSERDLSEWCDAAIAFWEELSVDDLGLG